MSNQPIYQTDFTVTNCPAVYDYAQTREIRSINLHHDKPIRLVATTGDDSQRNHQRGRYMSGGICCDISQAHKYWYTEAIEELLKDLPVIDLIKPLFRKIDSYRESGS